MVCGYAKLLSSSSRSSHMKNVGKPPYISILHSKFLLELGLILVHVSEFYDLGDDLSLEDWRLKWVTKVKNNGKLVLGYSMARRKSRISIELGVQRPKLSILNRFVADWNRLFPRGLKENYLTVGFLFPRGTKANAAAYGSGRGASCQRPGYQPSTNDGYPVLVLDRSGLAMITDRGWRFIHTENPWVGDSHPVYYQTFQVQVRAWKVDEVSSKKVGRLVFSRNPSLPLCIVEN
ncbi:hypothetical protein PIB30_028975 [Stylosanthes scabra]|uniref:Uncharacterized protein n=1 Tax=Stylosanthes scabra TaxID=79078 RepID=A0ABU6V984_9FABA|nr:hypothetical protein [Stylosanthes scabra]